MGRRKSGHFHLPSEQPSQVAPYRLSKDQLRSRKNTYRCVGIFGCSSGKIMAAAALWIPRRHKSVLFPEIFPEFFKRTLSSALHWIAQCSCRVAEQVFMDPARQVVRLESVSGRIGGRLYAQFDARHRGSDRRGRAGDGGRSTDRSLQRRSYLPARGPHLWTRFAARGGGSSCCGSTGSERDGDRETASCRGSASGRGRGISCISRPTTICLWCLSRGAKGTLGTHETSLCPLVMKGPARGLSDLAFWRQVDRGKATGRHHQPEAWVWLVQATRHLIVMGLSAGY